MRVTVIKGLVTHNNKDYVVGESFTCNKDDGNNLIGAEFVEEEKKTSDDTAKKDKTQTDIMNEGQLAELQAADKELEIDVEDKSYEELLEEVELAKDLNLEE